MSQVYKILPSPRSGKKWRVTTPSGKNVDFGQDGASDYTIHKDPERKERYISRHAGDSSGLSSSRENWSKNGTDTAGFWSRWLTWNLPDFMDSVRDIEKRFGIKIDTSAVKTNTDGSSIKGGSVSVSSPLPKPPLPKPPLPTMAPLPSISSLAPTQTMIPLAQSPRMISSVPVSSVPMSSVPVSSVPLYLTPLRSIQSFQNVQNVQNVQSSSPSSDPLDEQYQSCLKEASERKAKGKLKLCPEGYCSVKLDKKSFPVYPSYWANLQASKICAGEELDMSGNYL